MRYKTLKIKNKFMLIQVIMVALISLTSFLVLQIAFHIYGNKLIEESSEVLNLYSTNIENELRKIDKETLNILSEGQVQKYLANINRTESSYEQYVELQNLNSYLLNQADAESYISSVSLIDLNNNAYTVGNSIATLSSAAQKKLQDTADRQDGRIVWMEPQDGDRDIVAVREIRSIPKMQKLGDVMIRIDPQALVSWVSSTSPQYNAYLIILSPGNHYVYRDGRLASIRFDSAALARAKNGTYRVQGKKFLINREVSAYSGWTYIYLEPYQTVFQNLQVMRAFLIGCYAVVLVLMLLAGLAFARSITRPIVILSRKMSKIKDVNFEKVDLDLVEDSKCDEVGQLNNNFILMLQKIDELIKENYTKQILMKETQLKALQAQINPHFLYNTLDSINWLAKANGQERISIMVKSLGSLLRSSIRNTESLIGLREELRLLQDYINIQRIRFGDRLDFRTDIDEDILDCRIPKLTLQPIVENSIKYVLEDMTGVCRIEVSSHKLPDHIELVVRDNGRGIGEKSLEQLGTADHPAGGAGIGLKNIDERLKLFFGANYGLSLRSGSEQGMTVTVKIPY